MNKLLAELEDAFLKLAECSHSLESNSGKGDLETFLGCLGRFPNFLATFETNCRLQRQVAAAKETARTPHLGFSRRGRVHGLAAKNNIGYDFKRHI